ncbi:hypothetical protein [Campylobacter concisus]|uniref:Uncharacterized protein n=1 Tax=Campylobacter concisus TaxID=199 RepID=A0A2R4NZE3_9BACT|nr:hypothetical protein [Campylobacter concisus]AVX43807.1 hypothetical protein CCS77_0746 [Campylobacter concisus]
MQINSNFINLNKSAPKSGLNLKADEANLKSEELQNSDKSTILHDASNLASEANNERESSADVIKKQLEKLQKQLKEIDNAIKQASASKNPYAKELFASLQTKKGAIFAQIMQLNAQLVKMQGA